MASEIIRVNNNIYRNEILSIHILLWEKGLKHGDHKKMLKNLKGNMKSDIMKRKFKENPRNKRQIRQKWHQNTGKNTDTVVLHTNLDRAQHTAKHAVDVVK